MNSPSLSVRLSGEGRIILPPHPDSPLFPPEAWGTVVHVDASQRDPLELVVLQVPEGLLILGTCMSCGARTERLLDFRGVEADPQEVGPAHHAAREWAQEHRCAPTSLDDSLSRWADRSIGAAVQNRLAGKPNSMHLLLDNGQECSVDLPVLPEDGKARGVVLQWVHTLVRDFLRSRHLSPTCMTTVTECWVESPHGIEDAIVATTSTPFFGWIEVMPRRVEWDHAGMRQVRVERQGKHPLGPCRISGGLMARVGDE